MGYLSDIVRKFFFNNALLKKNYYTCYGLIFFNDDIDLWLKVKYILGDKEKYNWFQIF